MLKFKHQINRFRPNYCSKCGTKLSARAKFCPNCGRRVNDPARLVRIRRPILSSLGAVLIALILMGMANATILPPIALVSELIIGALLVWQCVRLVRRTIPVMKTGSKLKTGVSWFCLILATAAVGYGVGGVYYGHRLAMNKYQNLISDYLADSSAAKLAGDIGTKDGTPPDATINAYQKTVVKGLKNLQPPRSMVSYRDNVVKWADQLSNATTAAKWQAVGAEPAKFQYKVSAPTKQYVFKQLLGQIGNIKAYGDAAVANQDAAAIIFVDGQLHAQQYLLDSLGSQKAYCIGTPAKATAKNICSDKLSSSIKAMQAGISTYIASSGDDSSGWTSSSATLASTLQGGGQSVGKTTKGTADADKGKTVPVAVENFWTACKKVNGSAQKATVKKGLPVIDSGSNCYYQKDKSSCWDMLTDSGREFAGGEQFCPNLGLIPSFPTATNYHFDGTYDIHDTGTYCSTPDQKDLAGTAKNMVVANNEITKFGDFGQAFLNNVGDAQIAQTLSDGNQLMVNASFNQLDSLQGVWSLKGPDDCSGSFAGTMH